MGSNQNQTSDCSDCRPIRMSRFMPRLDTPHAAFMSKNFLLTTCEHSKVSKDSTYKLGLEADSHPFK